MIGPEKDSEATVLSTTGTSNTLAALARPTVELMIAVRSPLPVTKNICGWWSTNRTAQLSGVSRSGLGAAVTSAMLTMMEPFLVSDGADGCPWPGKRTVQWTESVGGVPGGAAQRPGPTREFRG